MKLLFSIRVFQFQQKIKLIVSLGYKILVAIIGLANPSPKKKAGQNDLRPASKGQIS